MNTFEIIPNAIPAALCRATEASWPDQYWPFWHRYNGKTANKYGSMDRLRLPPACIAALDALAIAFSDYIEDSFIDYDLHAAGMHMLPPGGFLARHLDAEIHPIRKWTRTHSIVMSVNSQWNANKYGGELVIETADGEFAIEPKQGQAIVFETPGTWHRVNPVSVSAIESRKTLALFAWSTDWTAGGSTGADFGGGLTSSR